MRMPYIHVSDHLPHFTEQWTDDSLETVERQGFHTIFAATVPFIPSFRSNDFLQSLGGGMGRIRQIVLRQIRFINDLANARQLADGGVSFDLRFISQPARTSTERGKVEIVFLGKVFHTNRPQSVRLGTELWRKFVSHFPLEDPFNYPLSPVTEEEKFNHYFKKLLPPEQIQAAHLLELRKYEDRDPFTSGEVDGYFPHPFEPALDFSAMGRFLETLSLQQQTCVVSICIRPTLLLDGELRALNRGLGRYGMLTEGAQDKLAWLRLYRKKRFEDLYRTIDPLIRQRNHLFLIKVQVIGAESPPVDVLEALGSEFMNNTHENPRQWVRGKVSNAQELEVARYNFHYMEHRLWGDNGVATDFRRLQSLVSAYEAAGAFRLPIPPSSGFIPGLSIKDEPFVMPPQTDRPAEPSVELGEIIHRGQPTGVQFHITREDLNRHALIGGSTGSGKTNTSLRLLSQLWADYGTPFLVLYPIDKPDYRLLMADPRVRDKLLLFTVGDEATSPFRFNPFVVAPGVLLKTHISQLMRCFSAAFSMWDPLPAVYRAALRQVYRQTGWDLVVGRGGDPHVTAPTMAQFYDAIVKCADELTRDYGSEVRGNVKQGAEIRIRDLLDNMGHVVNVVEPAPFGEILTRPTIMELGRVGSTEDTALVMGFMLMLISEELQSRFKHLDPAARGRDVHLTLVEEAHRLMSRSHGASEHTADPREKGGEDFSNLLAEVRGYGEGILIAEQIPTNLVQGAVGNTFLKVMHWIEDTDSFKLFCDIMNLDERQRDYVRTLRPGYAIVRGHNGSPVHVKVKNYLDSLQDADDRPLLDDDDRAVRNYMEGRVALPAAQQWNPPLSSETRAPVKNAEHQHGQDCLTHPETCSCFARFNKIGSELRSQDIRAVGVAADQQDWEKVQEICSNRVMEMKIGQDVYAIHGYLYHLSRTPTGKAEELVKDRYPNLEAALTYLVQQARTERG